MAIKPFTRTLSSMSNKPELADGPFRSLQDVQTYLDSIKTNINDLDSLLKQYQLQFSRAQEKTTSVASPLEFVVNPDAVKQPRRGGGKTISLDKIDKIVIPKMDTLRKNFSLADEISDQVDQLDKLYNSVAVNFRGVRGSNDTLKSIKGLQRNAESKLDKALKFLSDIGERHTPSHFKDLIQATIAYVSPELEFKNHKTYMYGYETKEGDLAFAVYIELLGLTDDEGNIYPKFYIVFNCILKPSSDRSLVEPVYYLTVMHDFATPGKYGLGKKISSPSDASTALGMMLEMESISTAIGTQPHNLDPSKVNKGRFAMGSRVSKINVDPSAITFELLKGVKGSEASEIAKSLYVDMKGLLAHIKNARIKVKVSTEDSRYVIKFTLTNLAKDNQVSVNDLDFLKETFGLDDTRLRKVTQIINSED
jgi:hypothetical protein